MTHTKNKTQAIAGRFSGMLILICATFFFLEGLKIAQKHYPELPLLPQSIIALIITTIVTLPYALFVRELLKISEYK